MFSEFPLAIEDVVQGNYEDYPRFPERIGKTLLPAILVIIHEHNVHKAKLSPERLSKFSKQALDQHGAIFLNEIPGSDVIREMVAKYYSGRVLDEGMTLEQYIDRGTSETARIASEFIHPVVPAPLEKRQRVEVNNEKDYWSLTEYFDPTNSPACGRINCNFGCIEPNDDPAWQELELKLTEKTVD